MTEVERVYELIDEAQQLIAELKCYRADMAAERRALLKIINDKADTETMMAVRTYFIEEFWGLVSPADARTCVAKTLTGEGLPSPSRR